MSKDALKTAPPPFVRRRDVRVDRIGFVNELVQEYIGGDDGVKAKVKAQMGPRDESFGDFFEAKLVPAQESVVSPSALMKLYENRTITRAQFVDSISASAPKCLKLGLSLKVLKRLIRTYPATPRLCVNRIEGMQFKLTDAVIALHGAVAGDEARAGVVEQLQVAA